MDLLLLLLVLLLLLLFLQELQWAMLNRPITVRVGPSLPPPLQDALSPLIPELSLFTPIKVSLSLFHTHTHTHKINMPGLFILELEVLVDI